MVFSHRLSSLATKRRDIPASLLVSPETARSLSDQLLFDDLTCARFGGGPIIGGEGRRTALEMEEKRKGLFYTIQYPVSYLQFALQSSHECI